MSPNTPGETGLPAVLRSLRRARDEAQFTQVIAAVAAQDPAFASALANVLVGAAPNEHARAMLGSIPSDLECVPEVRLRDIDKKDVGQVDLVFRDGERTFWLLVELKLHSAYGLEQLPRYLDGLAAINAAQKALVAVTTATPQSGEETLAYPDLWLGSVRWSQMFDQLHALPHHDAPTRQVWQALLTLMRKQGDFGPMDVDEEAIHAWALRNEAEAQMRHWLTELLAPIVAALEAHSGGSAEQVAKVLRPFVPWRGQIHAKLAVPGDVGEERLRVQFWADERTTYFDVEARYDHPNEDIAQNPLIEEITAALEAIGFECGSDGSGWYWAKWFDPTDWLSGADTLQHLLELATRTTQELAASGLFSALATIKPTTPASGPEPGLLDEAAP